MQVTMSMLVILVAVYCLVPDPCLSNPCDTNANCTREGLLSLNFNCTCLDPFTYGDGFTCSIPDPCLSNPCDNNANCTREGLLSLNINCTCLDPFSYGDGFTCSIPDPCLSNPCDTNANCTREGLLSPNSTCTCVDSFTGDGFNCSGTSPISKYRTELKGVYKNSPIAPKSKWPPTPGRKFIKLRVVKHQKCRDEYIGHALKGNIKNRVEISIEQILEADEDKDKLRLILIEGAPGIGKSTLAWELCRKWEDSSSMKQYSLVILLRLREQKVQEIEGVSDLFYSYEHADKQSLVEEVLTSQGNNLLFILDGFDELPKKAQKDSYLIDLITGARLPKSTVLITTRPSATATLLTSCGQKKIQKRIEILGFTQESVEAYAASVFDTDKLKRFKSYISASKNPAINSLMYIPLNAAIIVHIFKDSESDSFLPRTLTDLYTKLSLTILKRYLDDPSITMQKLEDLPVNVYEQFLKLSEVAFEGLQNDEVIFHSIPSGFDHFGFLDAESALYGGGGVSYNFLHLTLQEFFAAYYISQLGNDGIEMFKQYGKDARWNIVWRFVAGLTKFKPYEGLLNGDDLFIEKLLQDDDEFKLSKFFIQCLYEAQTVEYFNFTFGIKTKVRIKANGKWTSLDMYALGFSIAHYLPRVSLHINISRSHYFRSFTSGLMNTPSASVIEQLKSVHTLNLIRCELSNTDMIRLSELVPSVICLKELDISQNNFLSRKCGHNDGLLKVLQQLDHSNVTALNIKSTRFCKVVNDPPFYSAFKKLISGRLKRLTVGDLVDSRCDNDLMSLLSAPSSLETLSLTPLANSSLPYLINNTMLTKLEINNYYVLGVYRSSAVLQVVELLKHNKALRHLLVFSFNIPEEIDAVRTIVSGLSENITLKKLELGISIDDDDCDDNLDISNVSNYMKTNYNNITIDPRITWTQY